MPNSKNRDGIFGALIVIVIVTQALLEWTAIPAIKIPLSILLALVVFMMAISAGKTGRIFLGVCFVLTVGLVNFEPDWPSVLSRAVVNIGFLASFLSALSVLKNAASTSPAMSDAGNYLAKQPTGRRYLSLTFGTQIFALLLNYGAIQLLGTLALASGKNEPNQEVRSIRMRRMLLAIQRGFLSALPWSPMAFSTAIAVALIPGVTWAAIAIPGVITSGIVLGTGWALDTLFKPKLTGARPAVQHSEHRWPVLLPLLWLLSIILIPVLLLEFLSDTRIVGIVLVVVPVVAIGWLWVQIRDVSGVAARLKTYVTYEIASYRDDLLIIMSAGYLGVVGSSLIGPALGQLGVDFSSIPTWVLLLGLVWIMPVFGQFGANPILTMSLVAPLLPSAATMGIPPTAWAVALLSGWTMAGLTSPFTATNILISRFGEIPTRHVGWIWNRSYFLTTITLLSTWTLIFAFWIG